MNFLALIDPSTTLGAFLISVVASLFVGFISGKKYENYSKSKNVTKNMQKNKDVYGDVYQGCTVTNHVEKNM